MKVDELYPAAIASLEKSRVLGGSGREVCPAVFAGLSGRRRQRHQTPRASRGQQRGK
jgi:hypothetical protein